MRCCWIACFVLSLLACGCGRPRGTSTGPAVGATPEERAEFASEEGKAKGYIEEWAARKDGFVREIRAWGPHRRLGEQQKRRILAKGEAFCIHGFRQHQRYAPDVVIRVLFTMEAKKGPDEQTDDLLLLFVGSKIEEAKYNDHGGNWPFHLP
jgi:hypothetical protein